MIELEISVLGSKDCSDQPLFNVAIRNSSCGAVKSCYGYNLTPRLPNHTFCLVRFLMISVFNVDKYSLVSFGLFYCRLPTEWQR